MQALGPFSDKKATKYQIRNTKVKEMQNVTVTAFEKGGRALNRSYRSITALVALFLNFTCGTLAFSSGQENTFAGALIFLSFLICIIMFSRMINSSVVKPVLFMTLLYWIYALVLPAIYQARTDNFFWRSSALSDHNIEVSAVILLVGTLGLLLGSRFRFGSSLRTRIPSRLTLRNDLAAFIISAIILLYAAALVQIFGWQSYFLPRELAENAFKAASGGNMLIGAFAKTAPKAAAIAILAICLYNYSNKRRGALAMSALLMAIISNLLVNFPIATPRYFLVSVAFVVLGTVGLRAFIRHKAFFYVSAPILIYVVFPFLGQWNRGAGIRGEDTSISLSEYLAHGDMDGFQSLTNAVQYADTYGLLLGRQILSAFFFFVPRSIWENKGEPSGSVAAEAAGYSYLNISMPLPGEFFMDFGILGAFFGTLLLGVIARSGDEMFKNIRGGIDPGAVYAVTIASFIPIIVRGPLLSTVQAAMVAFFVIYVWRLLPRLRGVK